MITQRLLYRTFPGGPEVETLPANIGDKGLIPELRRFHKLWSN